MRVRAAAHQSRRLLRHRTPVANNAAPSTFTQPFANILNNRLEDQPALRSALRTALAPGKAPLLPAPYWSAIYDYANVDVTASVPFTAVNARRRRAGTSAIGPNLAGRTDDIGRSRLPRQGAYDTLCIHPDLGADSQPPDYRHLRRFRPAPAQP
jgi:hypothetical protein